MVLHLWRSQDYLIMERGLGTVINLFAGDLFSLTIDTADNFGGFATVDIANFMWTPESARVVPLPPAIALFGLALAGLGFMQKKKVLKTVV